MKRIPLFIFSIVFCWINVDLLAQVPGLTWTKNMGGPPDDAIVHAHAVATDASGNIYTTGSFEGAVDFNPGPGVFELTSIAQDAFISKIDANGNFVWAVRFGSDISIESRSITIDANGNVLIAGYFYGAVDFNPGSAVFNLNSFGSSDAFVLKLNSSGNFIFAKQIGGVNEDEGAAIQTDAFNNIYMVGSYSGLADFNPDASASFNLTAIDWTDAFITKLDQNGNFQWANSYGNDGEDYDTGDELTIDPTGNIYFAGQYGQGDSGYGFLFIKKLAPNGSLIWEEEIGNTGGVDAHSIQSDASGNIYFAGTYQEDTDFNPQGTPVMLNDFDDYVCKINPSGIVIWAKSLGFGYDHSANSMNVDINGNIFLTGSIAGFADMDPGAGEAILYTPGDDYGAMFISKLDNNGDYVWAQGINSGNGDISGDDYITSRAITTDNTGNIFVAGDLYGTLNLATGICLPNELTASNNDLFIMKLGPTSVPSTCFGVIEQPAPSSIACQGSSITLIALAAGAPRVTYQWQKFNGSAFVDISDQEEDGESDIEGYEGTNTPFLTIVPIYESGTGEFRCKVYGESVADAFSDVAVLNYSGSSNIPYVVANSGCGPGQFMITAAGGSEGAYIWYDQNENVIAGQVNSTFTTPFISSPTEFSVSKGTPGCQSAKVTVEVNTNACAPVPGLVWAAQPKTSGGSVTIHEIVIDASGNTYSTGVFSGTVDFDSGPGTVALTTASQEHFLLKLDKDRNVVWVKSLNDTGFSLAMHLSLDGSGNIYITGGFHDTVDFDPGSSVFNMTATGNLDTFITKLTTDGNFIWAKRIGGTGSAYVNSRSIASNANGVYLTGQFERAIDFDPGAGVLTKTASNFFFDIFIMKLDPNGNLAAGAGWAHQIGRNNSPDTGRGIAVDAAGNIYSIGTYAFTVDFDPSAGIANLDGLGSTDMYILKLNNAGIFQWARTVTSTGVEMPFALALDAAGNPHITGTFGTIISVPSVDFDPEAGTANLLPSNGNIFVLKLTPAGSFTWAKNFRTGDFDPGSAVYKIKSNIGTDVFVSQLDINGNFSWAFNMASTGAQHYTNQGLSIVTDTDGSIYTVGELTHTSDLDPGHCTFPLFSNFNGAFIQKIKPGIKTLCFNLQPATASVCDGVPVSLSAAATGTTNINYRWQKLNTTTSIFENLTNTSGYSGVTTPTLSINTTGLFGAGDYRCYVTGDAAPDKFSDVATLTVSPNNPPLTTGATSCTAGNLVLSASGGVDGQYRWYNSPTGGTALSETSHEFTTPSISTTTTYYVSIVNTCESTRTPVVATITGVTPTVTSTAVCTGTDAVLKASGGSNGQYRWYDSATGGTALSETSDTFFIASLTSNITYYVSIDNGSCESDRVSVDAAVATPLTAPSVTGSSHCGEGTITLNASGGTDGQYRWYMVASGGAPIGGEVNASFTTPSISSTTNYYVLLDNGCESTRTEVTAEIKTLPAAPTVTGQDTCGPGSVDLTAAGGINGQYRWYTEAAGGTALTGEVNNILTITSLTATTSYYVSVLADCESERAMITPNVFTLPVKPVISSTLTPNENTIALCKDPVTLTAPVGFNSYQWSNGAITQSIEISSPLSNISLIVIDANGCESPSSDAFDIIALASCTNSAPQIATTNETTPLEGTVTINLLRLISDDDDNLDPNSIKIIRQPASGAFASIDTNGNLIIDYKGVSFSGRESIGIEACDLEGVCTQQDITIDVVGEIIVYNGLSPNGDGKNDYLILQYIDVLEETKKNRVSIFNRWGDVVFEVSDYNNTNNYFAGLNKNGTELPSGNYFYRIDYTSGKESVTGYLTIKR